MAYGGKPRGYVRSARGGGDAADGGECVPLVLTDFLLMPNLAVIWTRFQPSNWNALYGAAGKSIYYGYSANAAINHGRVAH